MKFEFCWLNSCYFLAWFLLVWHPRILLANTFKHTHFWLNKLKAFKRIIRVESHSLLTTPFQTKYHCFGCWLAGNFLSCTIVGFTLHIFHGKISDYIPLNSNSSCCKPMLVNPHPCLSAKCIVLIKQYHQTYEQKHLTNSHNTIINWWIPRFSQPPALHGESVVFCPSLRGFNWSEWMRCCHLNLGCGMGRSPWLFSGLMKVKKGGYLPNNMGYLRANNMDLANIIQHLATKMRTWPTNMGI